MKKIFALLLALTMVFALSVPAFASEPPAGEENYPGSIAIRNAIVGETYTAYRIFDLESYNLSDPAFSYKVRSGHAWEEFVRQETIEGVYITIDDQGYVSWVENADAAEFARIALEYAQTNEIAYEGQVTATSNEVVINNLPLGYYLVDSSLGTLCSLDTTTPCVGIEEKNEVPELIKEVQEDETGFWGEWNDADVGDIVDFRISITAMAGAENYVVHDIMDSAFSFNSVDVITVTLPDTDENGNVVFDEDGNPVYGNESEIIVTPENYIVHAPVVHNVYDEDGNIIGTEEHTFDVEFQQEFLDTLGDYALIQVYYNAELLEPIDGVPHINRAWLSYGEGSETPPDETETFTWELNVYKYTNDLENPNTPLAGAEFILYKDVEELDEEGNTVTVRYYAIMEYVTTADNGVPVVPYYEFKEWTTDETLATRMVTDETGYIYMDGLDSGIYWLEEVKAPDGYNILADPIEVIINNDGTIGLEHSNDPTIGVENHTGPELPGTGGVGTTIFYIVGFVLMAGAAVLLITRKKMSVKND